MPLSGKEWAAIAVVVSVVVVVAIVVALSPSTPAYTANSGNSGNGSSTASSGNGSSTASSGNGSSAANSNTAPVANAYKLQSNTNGNCLFDNGGSGTSAVVTSDVCATSDQCTWLLVDSGGNPCLPTTNPLWIKNKASGRSMYVQGAVAVGTNGGSSAVDDWAWWPDPNMSFKLIPGPSSGQYWLVNISTNQAVFAQAAGSQAASWAYWQDPNILMNLIPVS